MHDATGPEEQKELEADLERAERDLSEYRQALHRRIATASEELIARYRDHPLDCLSALPRAEQCYRMRQCGAVADGDHYPSDIGA